jgi:hypothetical protein
MGPGGTSICKHCKILAVCSGGGYCTSCVKAGIKALEAMKEFSHYPLGARGTGYNAAILRLSHQNMARLLGLDDNHIISDMIYDNTDRSRRTLRIIIQGPGLYVNHEGAELPWIDLQELRERIRGF